MNYFYIIYGIGLLLTAIFMLSKGRWYWMSSTDLAESVISIAFILILWPFALYCIITDSRMRKGK